MLKLLRSNFSSTYNSANIFRPLLAINKEMRKRLDAREKQAVKQKVIVIVIFAGLSKYISWLIDNLQLSLYIYIYILLLSM